MKASYLVKGFPGHPTHPPLTDATIGMYTLAAITGVLGAVGLSEGNMAKAWWIALVVGLIVNAPTSMTGFADWLEIKRGTPLWKTATLHMATMIMAAALFGLAAIFGHGGFEDGRIPGGPLALTLAGFGLLTMGGWIGGSIVYVHGMRVLELQEEPTRRAVTPGHEEKAEAAGEREAPERPEPRA